MQLKGDYVTTDPRLDRIPQFDERSRGYPIRAVLDPRPLRSYTWNCYTQLDQGSEGACVGFSIAHELAARPVMVGGMNNSFAQEVYHQARRIDQWPGEDYSGTSIIAGVKVAHSRGFFETYRWAFSLQDVLLCLSYHGPLVIGINWYSDMHRPDAKGVVHPTGYIAGGHAILLKGISITTKMVRLQNSWGLDWGFNGDCFMSWDDLGKLLQEQGEAVTFMGRQVPA